MIACCHGEAASHAKTHTRARTLGFDENSYVYGEQTKFIESQCQMHCGDVGAIPRLYHTSISPLRVRTSMIV